MRTQGAQRNDNFNSMRREDGRRTHVVAAGGGRTRARHLQKAEFNH
jgi:hypothetical protein